MPLQQYRVDFSLAGSEAITFTTVGTVSCTIFESIYGACRYRVTFDSIDSTLGSNIAANHGKLLGTLRIGLKVGDGAEQWSTPTRFFVNEVVIKNAGGSQRVIITGTDLSYRMRHNASRLAFVSKTTDVIVKALASASCLDTTGVQQVNANAYTLRQCAMSDFDFVTDVLARRKGDDPLFCYVKQGNKFIFQKRRRGANLCTFVTGGQGTGNEIPFVFCIARMCVDATQFGVKTVALNQLKQGASLLLDVSENDANTQYESFGGLPLQDTLANGTSSGSIENEVFDSLDYNDMQRELKARSAWNPVTAPFRLAIPTGLLPVAELGKQVLVKATGTDGDPVYYSGAYLLYGFRHNVVVDKSAGTVLYLERRGKM